MRGAEAMHIAPNMGGSPQDLPDSPGVIEMNVRDDDVLEPIQTSEWFESVQQRRQRRGWARLHEAKLTAIGENERGHDLRQVLESEIGDLNARA